MLTTVFDLYEASLSPQIARDYRLLRPLGKGGMGDVFLAEQLHVGRRKVALKVLNRLYSQNSDMLRRFQNEAASAGLINHQNIVTVYESRITDDGQMYVAMEYVEGITLTRLIAEHGALPLARVLAISKQLCAGLAAAHAKGIVHRDIKPDNIMLVGQNGEEIVKVLDFGIARLSEATASLNQTRQGIVMGTPAYMSPEQAMGKTGDAIDLRSDIYSVGVVVYEMLTGKPVFEAQTAMEIMRKQVYESPMPLRARRPDLPIPAAVEQVILQSLEKEPTRRQQTADKFSNELEVAAGVTRLRSLRLTDPQRDIPTTVDEKASPTASFPSPALPSSSTFPALYSTPTGTASARAAETYNQRLAAPVNQYRQRLWLLLPLILVVALLSTATAVYFTGNNKNSIKPVEQPREPASVVASPVKLLTYKIKREKPSGGLDTLAADNTVKSGDAYGFEVKILALGSLYLFSEYSEKNDGSWRWLNALKSETQNQWLQIPADFWISADNNAGVERYLIIYVPQAMDWSPQTLFGNKPPAVTKGIATVSGEAASRLMAYLKAEASSLSATTEQQNREVLFSLSTPTPQHRVAYYEITLNHIR